MSDDDEALREVDEIAPAAQLGKDDLRHMPADLLSRRRAEVNAARDELKLLDDAKFWASDTAALAGILEYVGMAATGAFALGPFTWFSKGYPKIGWAVAVVVCASLTYVCNVWKHRKRRAWFEHHGREKELLEDIRRFTDGGGRVGR